MAVSDSKPNGLQWMPRLRFCSISHGEWRSTTEAGR